MGSLVQAVRGETRKFLILISQYEKNIKMQKVIFSVKIRNHVKM